MSGGSEIVPHEDDAQDLLEAVRYDELEDVQAYAAAYGEDFLWTARDQTENSVLHYAAANGLDNLMTYFLSLPSTQAPHPTPAFLACLTSVNGSKNTAVHWAAMNKHLPVLQSLCDRLSLLPSSSSSSSSPDSTTLSSSSDGMVGAIASRMQGAVQLSDPAPVPVQGSEAETAKGFTHKTALDDILVLRNAARRLPLDEAEAVQAEDIAIYLLGKMEDVQELRGAYEVGDGPEESACEIAEASDEDQTMQ